MTADPGQSSLEEGLFEMGLLGIVFFIFRKKRRKKRKRERFVVSPIYAFFG